MIATIAQRMTAIRHLPCARLRYHAAAACKHEVDGTTAAAKCCGRIPTSKWDQNAPGDILREQARVKLAMRRPEPVKRDGGRDDRAAHDDDQRQGHVTLQ
jgi:hypothetical protein